MSVLHFTHHQLIDRLVDFSVFGVTFFISCLLLSVELGILMLLQVLIYATVLLACVRVGKGLVTRYGRPTGTISRHIVGNAGGIFFGTSVMLLLQKLFAVSGDLAVVLVFSGIMAFFILGTLSPLIYNNRSSSVS